MGPKQFVQFFLSTITPPYWTGQIPPSVETEKHRERKNQKDFFIFYYNECNSLKVAVSRDLHMSISIYLSIYSVYLSVYLTLFVLWEPVVLYAGDHPLTQPVLQASERGSIYTVRNRYEFLIVIVS